mgnify:CR=1 FL=1
MFPTGSTSPVLPPKGQKTIMATKAEKEAAKAAKQAEKEAAVKAQAEADAEESLKAQAVAKAKLDAEALVAATAKAVEDAKKVFVANQPTKAEYKAITEAYKLKNPAKYELKKEAFAKRLASL